MRQVFEIIPGAPSAALFAIILVVPVLLTGLFGYIWYSMRYTAFEVNEAGVQIRGDIYGRTIPWAEMGVKDARVVDLKLDKDHGLSWRTNGIAVPGYASGWFRLKNGEKALVFLTKRDRVVYVPTTKDYALLVSPKDPDGFLEALRRH